MTLLPILLVTLPTMITIITTFAIKVGDAGGTVRLPQFVFAKIEIYLEFGLIQTMEIEMEVIHPRGEGEKPMFNLGCLKLSRRIRWLSHSSWQYLIAKSAG
ncbi:hypothetical protein [Pelosinus baikalensis]|uniref:Uncharacterized protein n=1 Tax=Pelosinus baikalensis TaxID=2892015 RepID=A0ABS8HZ48_9FIRM|nr:hypothetical protein [Pelosinus baikalensis]MCC5468441.1 hypothetical protein [Pelosinus baikalensis]